MSWQVLVVIAVVVLALVMAGGSRKSGVRGFVQQRRGEMVFVLKTRKGRRRR